MNRATIEKEIRDRTPDEEIPLLLVALQSCSTLAEWSALTACTWESTGPMSYQYRRIWRVGPVLHQICAKLTSGDIP